MKVVLTGEEFTTELVREYDGKRVKIKGNGGFIGNSAKGYLYEKNGLPYIRKTRNSRFIYLTPQRDIEQIEITI